MFWDGDFSRVECGGDEGGGVGLDFGHGTPDDGNVPHFSPRTTRTFPVEVDGRAGDGEGGACEVEMTPGGVWVGGAEDVDHD